MDKDYTETVVLLYRDEVTGSRARVGKLCRALQELRQQAIALPATPELTAAWCHASRAVVVESAETLRRLPRATTFDFTGRRLTEKDLGRSAQVPDIEMVMVADEASALRPEQPWYKERAERALVCPRIGDPNGLFESLLWQWRDQPNFRLQLMLDEHISAPRKRWLKAQRNAQISILDDLQHPARALLASDLVISDDPQTLFDASHLGRACGFVATRGDNAATQQPVFFLPLGSVVDAGRLAQTHLQHPEQLAFCAEQGWTEIDGAGHYALAAEIIAQLD